MDAKDAYRQVVVGWERSPTFGYVFRKRVAVDRRLQFGWRKSPGFWCFIASALERLHVNTSYENAVVTESGSNAIAHVEVTRSTATERPDSPACGCSVPSSTGGGIDVNRLVRYYVDDGLMVEVQWFNSGIRYLTASPSLASDRFRWFGKRSSRNTLLLSAQKSLVVGHTAGGTRLGDKSGSHNDIAAVREISQNSRNTV